MKTIKIPLAVAISTALIFFIEMTYFSVGRIINVFFSCKQEPMNSFPCFWIYDIYAGFIIIGIFILALLIIIVRLYKARKNRNIT
jgi:hypothetical protein